MVDQLWIGKFLELCEWSPVELVGEGKSRGGWRREGLQCAVNVIESTL